jgi:uncharacterized damage-inducible protein DinB
MKYLVVSLFVFFTLSSNAQQSTLKAAFLEKWENSKNYLLEIAEQMPEEYYGFRPTERQRSFQEQLLHIKSNMDWLSVSYFSSSEYDKRETPEPKSKAETISLLEEAFDATAGFIASTSEETLKEPVEFFAGPKTKLQIMNLLQDHVTHHRGQLIVYLNLKNVKPPRYVGW